MLDNTTKKRIDDLRNILVGKLSSPLSQVEQITTGLIYKFMYDMDQEAIGLGGIPSFFVGEFQKYSWDKLFDPRLGGDDKVSLYSEAIENLYNNASAPQFFRDIFKNSYLPFKDPATLTMFLKVVNEFHYSHSEKLGDAFEYLLSFMGSQGDAGQFRTPRHIIDFIVDIINPQKNERILDPACGTAGFLISSYKHILKQNTKKTTGDELSAQDKKLIGENLVGYDISPDMRRISLVNMYLHQFLNPKIYEYDTLSSEDRWNEYYDVILANPPFFSPKGGIQPHTRFGVKSNRAEVLFVDYIMEHLKPNGRAGIIVPDGIISRKDIAYKKLRKKLIENSLVGVISLPAGVFQPYSGVKTSILILDKEFSLKSDSIFFAKVENDGFSLGAQRTPIFKNDLPEILLDFVSFLEGNKPTFGNTVYKEKILSEKYCSFSYALYAKKNAVITEFEYRKLSKLVKVDWGNTNLTKKSYTDNGEYLGVSAAGMDGRLDHYEYEKDQVVISAIGANCGKVFFPSERFTAIKNTMVLHSASVDINQKFLFYLLSRNVFTRRGAGQPFLSKGDTENIEIPLPTIEVQQKIVDELEGYQKIIDGGRQVVENYKPTIDIDPSWEMMELKDIIKLSSGQGLTQKDFKEGEYEVYGGNGVTGYHNQYFLSDRTVVIGRVGAYCGSVHLTSEKCWITDNGLFVKELLQPVNLEYLALVLKNLNLNQYAKVGGQPSISQGEVLGLSIPFPKMETQNELVMKANHINDLVQQNNELIKIYTQKIQDRISKVWGNE